MADPASSSAPQPKGATGVLVLADGTIVWGRGFGATGSAVGEVCFNTAMTGYQEAMTDPSYAGQIISFTFPHIGNVGANDEDVESIEGFADVFRRGRDGVGIGHVELYQSGIAPDAGEGGLSCRAAARAEEDSAARLRKILCDLKAYSLVCSGYEGNAFVVHASNLR